MDVKKTKIKLDMQGAIIITCNMVKDLLHDRPLCVEDSITNSVQLQEAMDTQPIATLEFYLLRGFIFNRAIRKDIATEKNAISITCDEIKDFLLEKNRAYGDSAANPVRCFSSVPAMEQINVRLDDKLSRMLRGHEYKGDDTELDFIGYLLLKRAVRLLNGVC